MPAPKRAVQTPGDALVDNTESTDLADSSQETEVTDGAPIATGYASMHSSEVDATKLKKSVLCTDGWVVPDLPPQAPVRA